jgi:hypothetical protein
VSSYVKRFKAEVSLAAQKTMFPWHSSLAGGGAAPPASMRNTSIDTAYETLLQWLSSAPRDPTGRLVAPMDMLRALPPLSSMGRGMLLAICDMKGTPTREEFARWSSINQ